MEDLSIIELRERIADGRMTSVEATEAVFARIDAWDEAIGAYISIDSFDVACHYFFDLHNTLLLNRYVCACKEAHKF